MKAVRRTQSKYLGPRQQVGLSRLGDVITPGDAKFPSFSRLGCIEHIDQLLEPMPEGDRGDLCMLLGVLSYFPNPVLRGFVWIVDHSDSGFFSMGPVGALLRMMRLGLKGIVFSLYYSGLRGSTYVGPTPIDLIGYQVAVKPQ